MTDTLGSDRKDAPPVVTENITRLTPYHPGKPIEEVERELGITGIIKLASNENSLGPSPRAVDAIHQFTSKLHVYPDANAFDLRRKLSLRLGVTPNMLVFGNGSDDLIHLLGVTFLRGCDEVIQGDPSFVRYEAAAILNDCVCHRVPVKADWSLNLEAMAAQINDRTRLIFIANPNNPTGTIVRKDELSRFLESIPERALVVMDEAYYEYACDDPDYPDTLAYVHEGRNVILLRTFSKLYGLAGLRVGYGVMRPEIAQWIERTREPFNVNSLAQVAACAALDDTEHEAHSLAMNRKGMEAFNAAFDELGLTYARSLANFAWVDLGRDSKPVYEALMRLGVIVRAGHNLGSPTHLRVTIGTEAENAKFLNALRTVLL